jgi:3-hydroxyisobutyrate dehydrogenase
MGASMAGHVLEAGMDLQIHTRTREKANSLLSRGAKWAETPAEAADGADAVVSIVSMPADVEAVHLGAQGTLTAKNPAPILIDMTTSDPGLAKRIHAEAQTRGIQAIDAPVSGGDIGAREARLSIMVGGDSEAVRTAMPIFESFGRTIVHQGPAGSGQHTKVVNQLLVASSMIGACEALLYAQRTGLDPDLVLESVSSGAAGSWTVSNLAPRMVARDFEPGFFVEHFVKDLGIAMTECSQMGLSLPGLDLAHGLYTRLLEGGRGRKGTQALLMALEEMNS